MYKGIRKKKKRKGRIYRTSSSFKLDVKIYSCQKSIACNRLAVFFHIKNRLFAISRSWRWEICPKRVEVGK
jgi:hypothetical protein